MALVRKVACFAQREYLEEHEASALKRWLKANPTVSELYHLKEAIRGFYRIKGYKRAKRAFTKIVDRMGVSSLQSVRTIRSTLLSWQREVLAYFKKGLVQRKAYGLRSFDHYRLRVLNACR